MKLLTALLSILLWSTQGFSQINVRSSEWMPEVSALGFQDTAVIQRANTNKFGTVKTRPLTSAPVKGPVFLDFVGNGDIQKSLSEGKEINANTGLGIVFERFNGFSRGVQSMEFEAYINIFSTADTLKALYSNNQITNQRIFGNYILNPVSARQSVYLNTNIYFGYPNSQDEEDVRSLKSGDFKRWGKLAFVISGINARFIASNNIWAINDDTAVNLGGRYLRIGIFHEIIPDNYRVNEFGRSRYSCFVGINYTNRGLYGDLSSSGNESLRKRLLGSDRTSYSGIEFNLGFRLNNIRAEFQMPILPEGKSPIKGLTNTQFLFSIKFVGGFGLKLHEAPSAPPNQSNIQ